MHHHDIPLEEADIEVNQALGRERERQTAQIELIASENIVSRAVREALGHEINNKTLEGYPGRRFHGGGEYVDIVERLAIGRAQALFGADYVNVQPHSGTQANQAVFFALARPYARVLSLNLAAGGHLSHGAKANLSGRWFDSHHYGVDPESGLLDYGAIEDKAQEIRPALLIAGGSAYPRAIDFERMGTIARNVGARFMVDMAHVAGLVAAGVHGSPVPHADIVTCTTTKTLRGPRGGLIMSRSSSLKKELQSAVFPGVQGSLHPNVLAAKAVCLGEALKPTFRDYGISVVTNARRLAQVLMERGIGVVTGGHGHTHGVGRSVGRRDKGSAGGRRLGARGDHVEQEPHSLRSSPSIALERITSGRLSRHHPRLRHRGNGRSEPHHCRPDPCRGRPFA